MTKWQRKNKQRDRVTERVAQQFIIAGHNFLSKLFRLISSLNSLEYEIGFRLEEFFFSVFFFIHLLRKLNRLHLRSYGRWSSLFHCRSSFSPKFRFTSFILAKQKNIHPCLNWKGGGGASLHMYINFNLSFYWTCPVILFYESS